MINMRYTKMYQALQKILDKDEQIDYVMSNKTALMIELWSKLYEEEAPWLDKVTESSGIPAAIAAETARLTTLELKSEVTGSAKATYIQSVYKNVLTKLREQTEYGLAKGGLILKPYVTSTGISVQYIQADGFFPLEYDSERITRCAFLEQFRRNEEIYTRVELHTFKNNELNIRNRAFVSRVDGMLGTEVSVNSAKRWSELAPDITTSGIKQIQYEHYKVP